MKILCKGAEAILYLSDNKIVKERIKKNYRIQEIDLEKRKYPTRREARLLKEASKVIDVPRLFDMDDTNMKLVMEYIDGKLIKNILDQHDARVQLCRQIGNSIAKLHDHNIIHGDLTTSNMILRDNKIYFIDFGLGFTSSKAEDKAVDLHVLRQAIDSRHYKNSDECFNSVIEGYKISKNFEEVMTRLKKVESRGRYKSRN